MESRVKDHYNSDNLTKNIQAALTLAGKDLSKLNPKDLSPIDQLHTGGVKASLNLLKTVDFSGISRILDAGCGIGGSSRLLAEKFGCKVDGIDLADQFIDAALFLTRATGLQSLVSFQQGSILELPFEDNIFDAILCQHILMNIDDKSAAAKEFFRVLKPGGQLILHEITKGNNDEMRYPVPWASKSSTSFLEPWEKTEDRFKKAGFQDVLIDDNTQTAQIFWEKANAFSKIKKNNPNPLNPQVIFGKNAASFGKNMFVNFKTNSICLFEAIFKKNEKDQ